MSRGLDDLAPGFQAPDSLDAENLKATVDTAGYRMIERRIGETRERLLRELLRIQKEPQTNYLRGQIDGLGLALEIPRILRGELNGDRRRR